MSFRWDWHFARALEAFATAETEGRTEAGEALLPAPLRAAIALGRADVHRLQGLRVARDAAADEALRLFQEASEHDQSVEQVLRLRGATSETAAQAPRAYALVLQGIGLAERDALDRGEEACRRGLALYEAAGDMRGGAIALYFLATLAVARGHLGEADDHIRRSLRMFERCGGQYGAAACWHLLSTLAWQGGELALAADYAQRGMAVADQMGNRARSADSWHILGLVGLLRGDLIQAEDCFRRGLAIGEQWEARPSIVWARLGLGSVGLARGELREAARWCRSARRQAHVLGETVLEADAAVGLARTHLQAGRLRAAAAVLDYAGYLAGRRPLSWAAVQAALLAGEVQLRLGALPAARMAAEEALRLACGQGRRLDEAVAYRLLGHVALAQADASGAETYLRHALACQEERGAVLEAARTRQVLAQALATLAGSGSLPHEARTLLTEARAQFDASGAALDLARANRQAGEWNLH